MADNLSPPEFDERCFRFAVRCDRETNARIEKAARTAGLSPTAYVQRHFETILDGPANADGFSAEEFARRHSVTPQAALLFDALRRAADDQGTVSGSVADFAGLAGLNEGRFNYHFRQLVQAGVIGTIAAVRGGRKGTYRILEGR